MKAMQEDVLGINRSERGSFGVRTSVFLTYLTFGRVSTRLDAQLVDLLGGLDPA